MGGAIVIEHLDDLASRHAELIGVHRVEFDVRQRVTRVRDLNRRWPKLDTATKRYSTN